MPAPDPAVRVAGLVHRYGRTVAVEGMTLELPAGSATAVIGPDGVGKSTLLGLVAGVRRIQAGSVEVLGGDMASAAHRSAVAARIAYMPQGLGRNLYPTLTVVENIDFHARLFGLSAAERTARIGRLLSATGLDPFPDRPAGKLSGGMKQKLSLCCALVHNPDLLVLDEPTTGVDPLSRRQFWALVAAIRADRPGMTVVVATAYMEEAASFGRVVAIDAGRVIASGDTAEVLARAGARDLETAYRKLRAGGDGTAEPFVVPPRPVRDGAPAIVAEDLTRRFGDFTAVDHVSFRIDTGEIFGFLGSNGCGKTTTMKMLTGLLEATEGRAELFGRPVAGADLESRLDVGYMSQGFSLYEELTVAANLALAARLYRVPAAEIDARVRDGLERFDLSEVAGELPARLPLGLRQRLQLAAACLHRPRMLILDEPTSGVDPAARDMFWRQLVRLSREDGVTIFVSTHFMNEAERCDRISLMHRGRVLAVGTPDELTASRAAPSLEEAFVAYLAEAAAGTDEAAGATAPTVETTATGEATASAGAAAGPAGRVWAFARREGLELLRDRVRLVFALAIPVFLLVIFSFGISFDVEHLTYAAFDRDRSPESQAMLRSFEGSRYFETRPPIASDAEVDRRLADGELRLVVAIPPGFGRDLVAGEKPEVGLWIDGANTFRAETVRAYVQGLVAAWAVDEARAASGGAAGAAVPIEVRPRYLYNQAFLSVNAITPGVVMLVLVLIPAMMTALGVVREREIGSIANLEASPASVAEFLFGKQLAYVAVGVVEIVAVFLTAVLVFGVPFTGSLAAFAAGAVACVFATTAFGLLVSTVVSTQVAATFAVAILSVLPAVNFSGFMYPVASIEGAGRLIGYGFPAGWFQAISLGTFAKGLGFADLWPNHLALVGFGIGFLGLACLRLKKQEP
ncbi:ribosome-associated ATPase/putative transporter RbbA [Oharaeibacter diazotrophicus]|uniref:Ribosome-dependent ATPase n=1 Tax=Oharaeibacter diazotrophicus TaxID=1920512 RepID=A0A4R6RBL7_9HYPH|nr:ribosome-associated ATPase/putative transporter RbbA [Oharaeibacter diazotrophicus]TDP83541.1 ribosome-dependent ATPase [Oharaeibacter diazotrophicus]BBE72374.1 putative ABC transporter ATP-binding protein YbhF [Pleomorphomonas sp. SM30]GLS79145.1 multidrug ABC transporter ATP-binding protein [Oharaeibacter diazotrophicus]